jgi:hypothetical protein
MWPTKYILQHNAAPALAQYATHGCPVNCSKDWMAKQIETALKYGAHPSAKVPEALKCLITKANEKITNGFAKIIKWKDIKNNIPPKLKISPLAMIPQKSRNFRGILDLSFKLKSKNKTTAKSVNEVTIKITHQESMVQLGSALKRIIATLADDQIKCKKFIYSKLDIKDGFWQMIVSEADTWNFCSVIPDATHTPHNLDNISLVVPSSLQMGWTEFPPFFCAASETARDIISQLLGTTLPPHPFEN